MSPCHLPSLKHLVPLMPPVREIAIACYRGYMVLSGTSNLQHLALGVNEGNGVQRQMHKMANTISTFPIHKLTFERWKCCYPFLAPSSLLFLVFIGLLKKVVNDTVQVFYTGAC